MAAGLPKAAMSVIERGSGDSRLVAALSKIAANLYDQLEKQGGGDMPIRQLLEHAKNILAIDPAFSGIAAASALAGPVAGWSYVRSRDPNVAKAKALAGSLSERLSGGNTTGPMPIRVESDAPEMRPIRPGAASSIDPTKGRDVLEGI
jgi:hypothetical protein